MLQTREASIGACDGATRCHDHWVCAPGKGKCGVAMSHIATPPNLVFRFNGPEWGLFSFPDALCYSAKMSPANESETTRVMAFACGRARHPPPGVGPRPLLGIVNLSQGADVDTARRRAEARRVGHAGHDRHAGDHEPGGEAFGSRLAIGGGGKPMAARAEVGKKRWAWPRDVERRMRRSTSRLADAGFRHGCSTACADDAPRSRAPRAWQCRSWRAYR